MYHFASKAAILDFRLEKLHQSVTMFTLQLRILVLLSSQSRVMEVRVRARKNHLWENFEFEQVMFKFESEIESSLIIVNLQNIQNAHVQANKFECYC